MMAAYERALARRPIALKSGMGFASSCISDALAQSMEHRGRGSSSATPFAFDHQRSFAISSIGTVWNGPINHWHFGNLERWFPGKLGFRSILCKAATNQFFMNPFIYLPIFYTWTGLTYGRTFDQVCEKARREYWPSLKATWAIYIPFNIINFWVTPVRHQVPTNIAVSFLYNVLLSLLSAPRLADLEAAKKQSGQRQNCSSGVGAAGEGGTRPNLLRRGA